MGTPRIPPAVVLFLLAPTIGELLSGASPPVEFFNPISFLLLASLYGSGAVLIRELRIRWQKSYISLILLGAAYGVIEEGLMVKSFFDPEWMDLGILGSFGRWIGVNWVWAEFLTINHAVFSIAIPILLVELAYPDLRDETWVGRKTFVGLTALLTGVVFLGFFALTPYRPPAPQYLASAGAVLALMYTAYSLPQTLSSGGSRDMRRPLYYWASGMLTTTLFFLLLYAGPYILPHPILVMGSGGVLVGVLAWRLSLWNWDRDADLHKLALAAGGLSFFTLLAPLSELDQSRQDNPIGMTLVGLAFLTGILLMSRQVERRQKNQS